jgi:hypothetical protein
VRDFGTVLVGIYMLLDASANALAIEQSFSDELQKVIVVSQQDQQDQQDRGDQQDRQDGQHRQDQPTDQPTPR